MTTGNPLGLYSMPVSGPSINFVDLYGFFPRLGCDLSAAALGGAHSGKVMVHDSKVSCGQGKLLMHQRHPSLEGLPYSRSVPS